MDEKQRAKVLEQLQAIKPGQNYPRHAMVTEMVEGKREEVKFALNSFYVGMYCAIHINGATIPIQSGDHDNKRLVRGLKRDLTRALERGALVEIGALYPVAKDMPQ